MAEQAGEVTAVLGIGQHRRRFGWVVALTGAAFAVTAISLFALYTWHADEAVRYETTAVVRGDFVVTVSATGTVEPTNLVEISSELSGTLESVYVDFNDPVEVGTVLASLDTTTLEAQVAVSRASLEAAVARVAMARATLDDAREKYESLRTLDRQSLAARQDMITAQASFVRAQADLEASEADRKLAEANLSLREAELNKACICAPIAGVVLDRAVDPGQIVAASFSAPVLFTLAEDLTRMELQVDIDEADIGRTAVGNQAAFTVDAYDDRQFPAEIAEIRYAPETIDGVVTYKAILTVDNAQMLLRPGMTATAEIQVAEVNDALLVPNAALRYVPPASRDVDAVEERSGLLGMLIPDRPAEAQRGNERTVWVLRDGTPIETPVEIGNTNGQVTAIRGGELQQAEKVIVERIDG